jgi:hypothetical protein
MPECCFENPMNRCKYRQAIHLVRLFQTRLVPVIFRHTAASDMAAGVP